MGGEGKVEAEIGHISIAPRAVFNVTPNLSCLFSYAVISVICLLVLSSGEASHSALIPKAQRVSI